MKILPLEFVPVFEDQPPLIRGQTVDETWVCTIDARDPEGLFGIHAGFEIGPKNDYYAEHIVSVEAAKEWANQAWSAIVSEWVCSAP